MSDHKDQAREQVVVDEWKLIREQDLKSRAKAAEEGLIAAYRAEHPEVPAYVADTVVLALAAIAAIGKRSGEPGEG